MLCCVVLRCAITFYTILCCCAVLYRTMLYSAHNTSDNRSCHMSYDIPYDILYHFISHIISNHIYIIYHIICLLTRQRFQGNSDKDTPVYNDLEVNGFPIEARYIRLLPEEFERLPCIRLELYECTGEAAMLNRQALWSG